ncbi:MAG: hypothetical protein ACJ77E_12895 [Gaiellaceae bacterium]
MGPGEHRPYDEQYWTRPWATALFAGDLFEAIPFGDQPIALYTPDEGPEAGKHFVGEIAIGYGLLITPTCDMVEQRDGGVAHPYRTLVPVIPVALVAEQTEAVEKSVGLLRSRDTIHPYMYLPPLPGVIDEEAVACLFRPSLVSDELLADPPRRVAQLQPEARRHLKVKLAKYWGRVAVDPDELPLAERDEEELRTDSWPQSRYDDPDGPRLDAV